MRSRGIVALACIGRFGWTWAAQTFFCGFHVFSCESLEAIAIDLQGEVLPQAVCTSGNLQDAQSVCSL